MKKFLILVLLSSCLIAYADDGNDPQNSNKSWWQNFSEGIERANQYNQRMQANRPPVVNLTPGVVGGNAQPIDLGGKFNGQIQMSQPRNCTSVVYGNQINTNCN